MLCKSCGSSLAPGDTHTLCVLHRKCTRDSPCPLEVDKDGSYWDEIETIRAAAKGVRPKKKKEVRKSDGKKKKVSPEIPPLAPLAQAGEDVIRLESTGRFHTSGPRQTGAAEGGVSEVPGEQSGIVHQAENLPTSVDNRNVHVSTTNSKVELRPSVVSATSATSKEVHKAVNTPSTASTTTGAFGSSATLGPNMDSGLPMVQPIITSQAQVPLVGSNASFAMQTQAPAFGMNTGGMQVPGSMNTLGGMNAMSGMNMPFWFNPFMMQMCSGMNNTGVTMPWHGMQAQGQAIQQSIPSVVTTQPSNTSRVRVHAPVGNTQQATRSSRVSRQPSRAVPVSEPPPAVSTSAPRTSDPTSDSDDDSRQCSDDESEGSDSVHEQEYEQDDPSHQEYESSSAQPKVKEIFSTARVDPIIRAMATALNLEYEGDQTEANEGSSLQFGMIGMSQDHGQPILQLPNNIIREKRRQAKQKWRPNPPYDQIFRSVFRVPRSDYDSLLAIPAMDSEVTKLLPKGKAKKLDQYSPFLEQEMKSFDAHLKQLIRLSAFQFTLVNFLMDTLSLEETEDVHTDPTATANLVADIVGQQLRGLFALSHRTVSLRRENACASLRKDYVGDLPEDLEKLPFSDSHVFGSAFRETVRKLAKVMRDRRTLELELKPLASKGKGEPAKGNRTASGSRYASNSSRGNYRGRGRGAVKRARSTDRNTGQSTSDQPKAKRGRGRGRGNGPPRV